MTKLDQTIQGSMETHIFKCYCAEHSYLEIMKDVEDGQVYVEITQRPRTFTQRIGAAWKALRGTDFDVSNEVVIDGKDLEELRKALTL